MYVNRRKSILPEMNEKYQKQFTGMDTPKIKKSEDLPRTSKIKVESSNSLDSLSDNSFSLDN